MTPEIKQQIEQIRRGEVPEGFKHNSASVMPCDWNTCDFHEVATIQSGLVSPKEEPYCFMFHIGPDNIERDTGRIGNLKTACELGLVSGKFYFDAGSIVYSKIRPNLNKVCIPNFEGICSADCYSIKARAGIDRDYLFNLMLSFPFYRRAVACSMRTGMPKINQDDLNAIPVVMPSQLEEQQKIAAILTTQDKVIELKEKLLAEKQRQKKHLMQQLLTGKQRLPGYKETWATVELEEIFDYIQPTSYLVKSTYYSDTYSTPVLTAGKTFILGYTNETKGIFSNVPVVIFDDFTTATKFVDVPFKVKSSAIKILIAKKEFNIRFVYEAMQLIHFTVGNHERHWISQYSHVTIDVPCLEEQTAIAEILCTADHEIDLLQQELEQEKQKKKALMQLLLTGIVRVNE